MDVTLTLSPRLADLLRTNSMRNFYAEQVERFEHYDGPSPIDPVFDGGTMHWCDTASDALLLRAYELAHGRSVAVLSDLSGHEYCLLTSQPWSEVWESRHE